ncbi:MAG: molybdate ABC transporter permease subunit [Acidimicrobiales bacterium]|jgi:molybdate transport system permease protein|nr:molybdate ABC transporter permease subunit [Acidimicrobiales bacterium]MDP6285285.1 molybdate ABC transporter permease subunit [Acidimicrobiales bacterium]HJO40469.1 molybdate ABC transporter permease subunit [Acidimicrobiales bacterium]
MNRIPKTVVLFATIAILFLLSPLIGLLQRMPWSGLADLLGSDVVLDAFLLSLLVSFSAALAVLVFGIPIAWFLARSNFPFMKLLRAVVLLPMVLPPVVGGTALLFAFGRQGFLGKWLSDWFGLTLPFTTAGSVVAAVFVSMPFFVVAVESAFRSINEDLEKTAETLGASPPKIFLRITLPRIFPSIIAGLALSWARALGEFGATITFAGNMPGETQTLPLAIFLALETKPEAALALSLVMIVTSLAILIPFRDQWLPSR